MLWQGQLLAWNWFNDNIIFLIKLNYYFSFSIIVGIQYCEVCTESIQPCDMKIETFIKEDVRYKKQCT